MKIRTLGPLIAEAFISLRRNGWMALASASTVAIALLILGSSLLLVLNTNKVANFAESQIEISAFLALDTDLTKAEEIQEEIKKLEQVEEVQFIPKEKAIMGFQDRFDENKGVKQALAENNPLPDKLRIKVSSSAYVNLVAEQVKAIDGIYQVNNAGDLVDKVSKVTKWIRSAGTVVIGLLALAAVFLISTTIRLTVFARKKEIGIMKYLGATDWFIRFPFLLEGIILGVMGAIVAVAILYFSYFSLADTIQSTMPFMPIETGEEEILQVFYLLIWVGAVIGALGSMISVRKFLKV